MIKRDRCGKRQSIEIGSWTLLTNARHIYGGGGGKRRIYDQKVFLTFKKEKTKMSKKQTKKIEQDKQQKR